MRILQVIWSGLTSLCKKCDDIITCAGSGPHLRPDRIEPSTPYFGKSLPVCLLSLLAFLRWYLLSMHLWFVVCFGKLSLSDNPIRNNRVASDPMSTVAKVPSKWRGRRKRTEFQPCWRVKCGMSLQPAGNIQLRISQHPIDLQKCWKISICAAVLKVASKMGPIMRRRDIPHQTPVFSEWTGSSFLFISHTTNVLLFKFCCNIFIDVRIIKEMPVMVASGTPCSFEHLPRVCKIYLCISC